MEIVTNSILNLTLNKFGLHVDEFQNINYLKNNDNPIESVINQEQNALSIIAIASNLIGWLLENNAKSYIFFKLSTLSCTLNENKFLITKLLTPPSKHYSTDLLFRLNSEEKYFDAYKFKVIDQVIEEDIFEKVSLLEIINYLLIQEEHGSFISIYDNEFRLISIQDGLISITSNNFLCVNEIIINQLLNPEDFQYREWLPE